MAVPMINWIRRRLTSILSSAAPPPKGVRVMSCNHRHVVIHRNDVEEHRTQHGEPEITCSCNPGIICPVCNWDSVYRDCIVLGPPDTVDLHSVVPPHGQLN